MTNILSSRKHFRPLEFPEFYEYHLVAIQSPWSHTEVPMQPDVLDFNATTPEIRNVIGGILRGFTLAETLVGEYWRTIVCGRFSKPEIIGMATAFSAQEAVHAL